MTIKFNFLKLRMDQATDNPPAGAPAPEPAPAPAPEPTPAPAAEEQFDSHGYPIVKPPVVEEPPADDPSNTFPKPGDKPPEDPPAADPTASGYDKPPAPAPKADVVPPKVDEPPKEGDLTVADKGELSDGEVTEVLAFANKHKLPQSVVDDMIADRKSEIEAWKNNNAKKKQDAQNAATVRQNEWYDELKADPDFGGDNFSINVKKVDKLVADFMPNIKKELTKGGGMLPPYIMRDFFKLANHLHKTGTLVEGDPAAEKAKEELKKGDKTAHLDFYKDS